MNGMLQVSNLHKRFGSVQAVNGVNLRVEEGQIFGLLGPNGAGKSTALSMVCGLLKADKGNISVGGWDIKKHPAEAKKMIGVVPQEPALYPQLSAEVNLRFWGTINGLRGQLLDRAVKKALATAGLEDRAGMRMDKYSGGMKRRLNIAAGLVHNPRLLIMDEPTVGVDPQSRNHILNTVRKLKDEGTTVVYTSHYVEEVEYLCDRVAVMDHGRILAEGDLATLLNEAGEYQELVIHFSGPAGRIPANQEALPGVKKVQPLENGLRILTASAEQLLPLAYESIVNQGFKVSEIKIHKPNLESLFLKLTGRALRD